MAAPLPSPPRLIVFDTYGTLIDWDSALRTHLTRCFADAGAGLDVAEFYQCWYYGYALPAVSGPFMPYRDLLRTTMTAALAEARVRLPAADVAALGDVMAAAEPFPDSVAVLDALRRHVPLATISNSQQDIIRPSAAKLGNPFTHMITGEMVQAYKPQPALFELVLHRAGVSPREVVHVAQSQYVDLPRSVPMGMATVWINRQGQRLHPETPEPTAVLPDLTGLPALLGLADPPPPGPPGADAARGVDR